jgi:tetratricopeptide (TPR) repeat protein
MADRVVARLTLPPGATLRDTVNGASIVIDVLAPAAGGQPPAAQGASQPVPATAGPADPLAPGSGFASAPPIPAAPAQSAGAPVQLVPPVAPAAPAQPTPPASTPAAPVAAPAETESAPKPVAPADAARVPVTAAAELPVMPVAIEADEDGARLQVTWPQPVAAAAFRRAGVVWLVFDRPSRLDLNAVIAAAHPALGMVSQLDHPSASILQFSGDQVATPRLVADGAAWIIDFRPQAEGPLAALEPRVEMDGSQGGRVELAADGPSQPIEIVDPEVGDPLVVVALHQQGGGVAPGREWPDFALLPTQQGVVVAPRREGVAVAITPAGVVIRGDGGLLVSREAIGASAPQTAAAEAQDGSAKAPTPNRLFDLVGWRREGSDFITARQELQHAAVGLDEAQQNIARLDLARFYFAHGLAAESAGLLDLIGRGAPDPVRDPELLLLSGASHLLHDDLAAAREELQSRVLDGEPEAELWRAALAASTGEWESAASGFRRTTGLVDTYPHVTRARLLLLAAEAEIEAGDPGAAIVPLDALRKDAPTPDEAAQLAYLDGLKAEREGRLPEAESAWRALTESNHQPTRARAIFQLTELMLRQGELQAAEAIERMERLRFIWRGGPFEFTVLHRLGQLYLADGRPREGLTVLRQAVANFPDHRDAQAITGEMADAFRDLYLDDGAPKVSPLVAVALYDEFRELTPAGAEGDRLIAGLADRLVEVDLLERADKLLDDQIRYRLHGLERAEAGARLAEIRLRDRRPDDALAALRSSSVPGLPEHLTQHRNHLQARALYESGQAAEALALLESDATIEGTAQRADMLWRLREWAGAAEALGHLLDSTAAQSAGQLDGRRAGLVLNRAIALTLAGNGAALEQLAGQYGEAIAQTAYAEPFKLLTDSAGDDMTTRSIAEQLASASRLETFLADYRQQVQTASAPPEG